MMPHMPGLFPILIIGLLFVVLFGAQRLPEAARALGRSSQEFKKGLREGNEPETPTPALKD